jgi:hypothetical protein
MSDQRILERLLYSELQCSKCSQGSKKKCFKDTFRTLMNSFDINIVTWEDVAQKEQFGVQFLNKSHQHTSHSEKLRQNKKDKPEK